MTDVYGWSADASLRSPLPMERAMLRAAQLAETKLLLRWASACLSPTERLALSAFVHGIPMSEAAAVGGITRGGVWMAQQSGFKKLRRKLRTLGIESSKALLSDG